eukprot:2675337-Rhodomonas_salina.1
MEIPLQSTTGIITARPTHSGILSVSVTGRSIAPRRRINGRTFATVFGTQAVTMAANRSAGLSSTLKLPRTGNTNWQRPLAGPEPESEAESDSESTGGGIWTLVLKLRSDAEDNLSPSYAGGGQV